MLLGTYYCDWYKHPVPNQVGDTAGAIQHYELAGTHCVEVPRMLFERGRVEDLEEYITQVSLFQLAGLFCPTHHRC